MILDADTCYSLLQPDLSEPSFRWERAKPAANLTWLAVSIRSTVHTQSNRRHIKFRDYHKLYLLPRFSRAVIEAVLSMSRTIAMFLKFVVFIHAYPFSSSFSLWSTNMIPNAVIFRPIWWSVRQFVTHHQRHSNKRESNFSNSAVFLLDPAAPHYMGSHIDVNVGQSWAIWQ